ncbi:MAG: thymidine kinase [Bacilli bacterium]
MAKLIFNYSAMGSGKTMDLLRTAFNYEENGLKVLVMKPSVDTKGGDSIVTRVGMSRKVDYLIGVGTSIIDLISDSLSDVSCIFIDEAQFLSEQQVVDLFIISNNYDVPVICYGLRTDFRGNLFPGSSKLLGIAEELHEFKSLCSCGEIARYNARRVNGKYIVDGDSVLIDGTSEVEYVPLCGNCYTKYVLSLDK